MKHDELISREQAIDAICFVCGSACDKSKFVYNAPQDEQVILCPEHYALSTLPSAQHEQRTGKWIPQDHNKRVGNISTCVYYYPTCSECGKVGNETYKYCPHCGAKMTEGDAE